MPVLINMNICVTKNTYTCKCLSKKFISYIYNGNCYIHTYASRQRTHADTSTKTKHCYSCCWTLTKNNINKKICNSISLFQTKNVIIPNKRNLKRRPVSYTKKQCHLKQKISICCTTTSSVQHKGTINWVMKSDMRRKKSTYLMQ